MTDSPLLTPVRFPCGVTAANRLALAPLTNSQSHDDGVCSDLERRWLVRRAEGGFGIVSTCASHVSEDGQGFEGQLGCWGDHQLPGLTRLASEISEQLSLPLVQLYHGGVRAPERLTGQHPWSASAFPSNKADKPPPRAATLDDIERTLDAFVSAAQRAARAGFGGVEIHGAHGYLPAQFLSRTMNLRTDDWGGSFENRARFLRSLVQGIRAAVPERFVVGVRISPEDFGFADGLDLDENLELAAWLADDGADFLHISLWDWRRNTAKYPDKHPMPLFRAAVPAEVPLFAAGKVWTRDDAERLHTLGADVVSIGRAAIIDPTWPHRVIADGGAPIRGPRTPDQYDAVEVSKPFVAYLRQFRNMVIDP